MRGTILLAAALTAGHTSHGVRGECVGAMEQRREWAGAPFVCICMRCTARVQG